MKTALWIMVLLAATMAAQDLPAPNIPAVEPTAAPSKTAPAVSKNDEKKAKREFSEGLKLQKAGKLQEALSRFEAASQLVPSNVDYATAREMTKQQAVLEAIHRGNEATEKHSPIEAQASYRAALAIDPDNVFAQQQLKNSLPPLPSSSAPVRYTDDTDENYKSPTLLAPQSGNKSFSYRGDARGLLTTVMQAYGITATIDDSVSTKRVRFDLDATDFEHAADAASVVTKTFWVPLGLRQVLIMADTASNRRDNQKMVLRTFYFPDATTPTELQDLVNVFRVIFDVRFVVAQPTKNTITVRAPQPTMEAVTAFFAGIDASRPQIAIDVNVIQVSTNATRQLGLQPPDQFTAFSLGTVLSQLGSTNINDLLNQLIASGAINGASGTSLQALLAQTLGSNSQLATLFQTPFVTFGGGLTLFAMTVPGTTFHLNLNQSDFRTLSHMTMRASQNNAATLRIGQRYPILNASFAPIYNTPQISALLRTGSYVAPFPSFNYEDLGLTVKATPAVQGNRDIRLNLEMQMRSLTGASNNGVPIINNQEYKGTISLKDGEPAVVVSYITSTDSRTLAGVPLLGALPGIGRALSNDNKERDRSELMILITPRIVRLPDPKLDAIAVPRGS